MTDDKGHLAKEETSDQQPASESLFHKMLDEVRDYAIILLDAEGYITEWNKGAQQIKGYKASEIIGKRFEIFYTEGDRATGLPNHLLKLATMQGSVSHEGWRIRKNGTKFWGSVVITAMHDENDKLIGFSKVTRDLTDRKKAEDDLRKYAEELEVKNEELRQSEERYHLMVEEVQEYAILYLNRNGIVENWNQGAQKIKGYKAGL